MHAGEKVVIDAALGNDRETRIPQVAKCVSRIKLTIMEHNVISLRQKLRCKSLPTGKCGS